MNRTFSVTSHLPSQSQVENSNLFSFLVEVLRDPRPNDSGHHPVRHPNDKRDCDTEHTGPVSYTVLEPIEDTMNRGTQSMWSPRLPYEHLSENVYWKCI